MTRKEWEVRTLRAEEKALGIPVGWWGTYDDVRSPSGVRVRCSAAFGPWTVRDRKGAIVSKHDSRTAALKKARAVDEKSTEPKET